MDNSPLLSEAACGTTEGMKMKWIKETLSIESKGKGLYEFTNELELLIQKHAVIEGQLTLFIQHTSASLVISENADPTARQDLERFLDQIAPENQHWHRHTLEGSDDSPSHMKSIITSTSETIPIEDGELCLGTWQGVYLFEHRERAHRRSILLRLLSI